MVLSIHYSYVLIVIVPMNLPIACSVISKQISSNLFVTCSKIYSGKKKKKSYNTNSCFKRAQAYNFSLLLLFYFMRKGHKYIKSVWIIKCVIFI